mgnify:CR=1 FL=1
MSAGVPAPNPRISCRLLYQDDHVRVGDKPARLVTLPGKGHEHDTLLNGLMAVFGDRLRNLGSDRSFGLLHRLDKGTSGVLIVALTTDAYDGLRSQFESRRIEKYYWAVCHKAPASSKGVITKPIAEREIRTSAYATRKEARLASGGQQAVTAYRVVEDSSLAALIEARAVTGRLHQVRLHLDFIGSAILGDSLYGPKNVRKASSRLALHAHRIAFTHPVTGGKVDARSPWPRDLRPLLLRMKLSMPRHGPRAAGEDAVVDGGREVAGDGVGSQQT